MTDNRIEKIRAEIERRYNEYMAKDSELAAIRADECLGILSYIDSMQEEPVSEDLEEPASSVWHDASEPPIIDKTFLLVAPNGNSSLCLWGGKELHSVTIGGGHSVLCKGDIYSYIDDLVNLDNSCNFGKNLQEEPVSKDTPFEPIGIPADAVELANIPNKKEPTIPDIVDEHYWEMLGEEHVSEDLEKEIEIYMGTNLEWDSDALRDPIESWGIKIARHFAAWQKEQDKQWLAEEHKHIFAKGRDSMKQQIMKNVKDGVITFDYYGDNDKIYGCIAHDSFCLEELGLKDGDKVKLIIIKED